MAGQDVERADERRDEARARTVVDLERRADLLDAPSFITTMRSEIDSASSWSWVTKIVVMPSSRWIARISSRSETRILASSADSGSSSSSTCGLRRKRAGQRHALLLAAGQLVRIAVAEMRQLDQLAASRRRARRSPLCGTLRDLQAEGDVLRDRHVREQRIGLEHHADVALVRRRDA